MVYATSTMRRETMKLLKSESGQVLVLTALGMVVLLGFVGLATDVGVLFRVRHNLQIAADAAATAGALYESYGEAAIPAARAAATENGVTDGVDGGIVTIHVPPASGPASTTPGFVEAIVAKPASTVFMALFGYRTVTVSARAVAGPAPGTGCMYLTNTSGPNLSLQGSGTIEAPNGGKTCGIYGSSTDPNSVSVKGQGNYVNTDYISTAGGLQGAGNSNTSPTPITTYQYVQSPPESLNITPQNPSNMSPCTDLSTLGLGTTKVNSTTYYVLTNAALSSMSAPYCFKGNVMLQGTSTNPLTLPPGLYAFGPSAGPGTGQVAIGDYVNGTGITLDIYGDGGSGSEDILTVTSTANSTHLSAPHADQNFATGTDRCSATGGACYDVLLLAPKSNNQTFNLQWGSSGGSSNTCQAPVPADSLYFDGIIDAPSVNVSLQDQGGYSLITGMVVGSLTLKTGILCVANYATSNPYSPFSRVTLVE